MNRTDSRSPEPISAKPAGRNIWQWLIEPASSVTASEDRRRAQLLASLLVFITPVNALGLVASMLFSANAQSYTYFVQGATTIVLLIAYGLSRTKYYGWSTVLTLASFSVLPFTVLLAEGTYTFDAFNNAFMWVILPLLLGNILLTARGMAILTVANLLSLSLLPVLIRQVTFQNILLPEGFVIAIAGLLLVATHHRNESENNRRTELLENAHELQTTRALLEQHNRSMQTMIEKCAAHMTEVGRGNLTARLILDGEERSIDDPLIALARQLNEMTISLQQMILQIRTAADNLNSASGEILSATTQQASGASEQSAAITQTSTTVDEVKTIAEQSSVRAQEVANAAQRTVDVSRSGQRAVQDTIESMGQIKERVEGIAENILALSEQTQQIGEIIATVNSLASQSNILALNASIEAARAGEHGKGFAVVALEVRNLAEQSRQATAQVKTILSQIQKATNATVMATEEGAKGVDKGVALAAQTRTAIEQLAGVITESAQAAVQMVAGGRQQATGIEQIALAMQNINQATVQSLASTRQAEKSAQDLNDLAHSLAQTVAQYQV
jgi:methyl-accepting chemotaxis protein